MKSIRTDRPVAIWLLTGVLMIIVQIILGGITRLTDSGLSITEWKPILGSLPPTSQHQWQEAFEKYQQIAQFKQIHSYFTLEDFKSIYFWEWLHRNWGRLMGLVFIIPFIIFLRQKRFHSGMVKPMVILFVLGGLQGLVGWIMVQSGLNEENLYVSHIRLSIHFTVALLLLVYVFWFALQLLLPSENKYAGRSSRGWIVLTMWLLIIQLFYGAFMAGLKAAPSAPTWPTINGEYLPANLGKFAGRSHSFFSALVNDPITVHFIHRNLAYLIALLVVVWTIKVYRQSQNQFFERIKWIPLIMILAQVGLGIATVLTSPTRIPRDWGQFEWYALLHQFIALLFLLSLVLVLFLSQRKESAKSTGSIEPERVL